MLTKKQMKLIQYLRKHPEGVTPSQVPKEITSVAYNMLATLLRKGYVTRSRENGGPYKYLAYDADRAAEAPAPAPAPAAQEEPRSEVSVSFCIEYGNEGRNLMVSWDDLVSLHTQLQTLFSKLNLTRMEN
jgi:hypothetical protein